MSEWDKTRDKLAKLMEADYKKNHNLELINTWYQARVLGDRLQEEAKSVIALDYVIRIEEKKRFKAEQKLEAVKNWAKENREKYLDNQDWDKLDKLLEAEA